MDPVLSEYKTLEECMMGKSQFIDNFIQKEVLKEYLVYNF